MGTIRKEVVIAAPATAVWDAVRDVGALHTRLVPGMVSETRLEDDGGVRVVTFDDGLVLRERIIDIDDVSQRLVWSVVGDPFEHHNAAVDVIGDEQMCRMVWTADLLPNSLIDTVSAIMERGLGLSKQILEASAGSKIGAECKSTIDQEQHVFSSVKQPTLHHVSLFVSDLEKSKQFYTSGLGLSLRKEFRDIIGQRDGDEFPFEVASVFLEDRNGLFVELHPTGKGVMSDPGFPLNHLALAVADVEGAYTRALQAGGVAFDIPIPNRHWDGTPLDVKMTGERPESMRMAFLQGPSGELIELYQAIDAD